MVHHVIEGVAEFCRFPELLEESRRLREFLVIFVDADGAREKILYVSTCLFSGSLLAWRANTDLLLAWVEVESGDRDLACLVEHIVVAFIICLLVHAFCNGS